MRYVSNNIRLAVVDSVDHDNGIAYVRWLDQISSDTPRIPIPHPYAGSNGEGIFIGLGIGSIIALDMLAYERYVPVGIIPLTGNYNNILDSNEISFDNVGYPKIDDGEIVIQGRTGGKLRFDNDGTISLQNEFEEGFILNSDSDASYRCSIIMPSPVEYTISQTGIYVSGIVRRDAEIENNEEFINFLTNPFSEIALEEIGWDNSRQVVYISRERVGSGTNKKDERSFRNPGLVEDRQILLEFGREWLVGTYDEELRRLESDLIPSYEYKDRRERRNNILSLSLTYPNELLEKVSGTLVDVFGNMLDINKNIILHPEGEKEEDLLDDIFEKLRHGVAYHMEVNTRKGRAYREETRERKSILLKHSPNVMSSANNARDRSRWAFRIDKEGLTTINIPATSETGNIPLLTRQETSSVLDIDEKGEFQNRARTEDESKEIFRNEKKQDIFLDQVGPGGIAISGNIVENRLKGKKSSWTDDENLQKIFGKYIEAGTAFHDITKTAINILTENINKKASDIFNNSIVDADPLAVSGIIDPRIPKETGLLKNEPNAGGRSVQVNLDGSLEMSIGANTVDRVAFTLDTAGALVTRLGRDRQGRSAIIQADGSIILEVGGWDFIGEDANDQVDTRFVGCGSARAETLPNDKYRFRDGKVVIRIRRANKNNTGPDEDKDDHLLILDETGISIESSGRLNIRSDMDLTIKSGGQLILDGEAVRVYEHNSRFITKSGRRIA